MPLEDKFPCEECNNSYCTREALAKHMKTKHDMVSRLIFDWLWPFFNAYSQSKLLIVQRLYVR